MRKGILHAFLRNIQVVSPRRKKDSTPDFALGARRRRPNGTQRKFRNPPIRLESLLSRRESKAPSPLISAHQLKSLKSRLSR
jgi:hypothetical protein